MPGLELLVSGSLLVQGLVHVTPLVGVLGPRALARLYAVQVDEPNLAVLMRHRAVLFGILGAFCLWAAFVPEYQVPAFIGAFASLTSFLLLTFGSAGCNPAVRRVAWIDVGALLCLLVGAGARLALGFGG